MHKQLYTYRQFTNVIVSIQEDRFPNKNTYPNHKIIYKIAFLWKLKFLTSFFSHIVQTYKCRQRYTFIQTIVLSICTFTRVRIVSNNGPHACGWSYFGQCIDLKGFIVFPELVASALVPSQIFCLLSATALGDVFFRFFKQKNGYQLERYVPVLCRLLIFFFKPRKSLF